MSAKLPLFFILLLLLFPCGFAHAQETLRILCWQGYAPAHMVDKFEAYMLSKHQLVVNIEVSNVSEPSEFFQNIREGTADIISPAHNIPKSLNWPMIQSNIVAPFDLERIPNYQYVTPFIRSRDFVKKDGKVYGIPVVYGLYGLAYNQEKVNQQPESWDVLWDPAYRHRYVISADYYEANIYITALALGYTGADIFDYDLLSRDKRFIERLYQLATYAQRMWQGVDTPDELQNQTFATAWGFSFSELHDRGEAWSFASPKEGVTGWVDYWVMNRNVKRNVTKDLIAHEWVNFALGNQMQLYYLRELSQFPVTNTIEPLLSAEEIDQFKVGNDEFLREHVFLWQVLSRRQTNGFKLLWERAKQARKAHQGGETQSSGNWD